MVEQTRRCGWWGWTARWVATGLLAAGTGTAGRADEPGPLKAILVEVPGGPPVIKYVPVNPPAAVAAPGASATPAVAVKNPPPPGSSLPVGAPAPLAPTTVDQSSAPAVIVPPSAVVGGPTPELVAPTVTSQVADQVPPEPTKLPDLILLPAGSPGTSEADSTKPTTADAGSCATCGVGVARGGFLDRNFPCAKTPATVPPPLGMALRSAFDMQRANALAEYFVVYREDWLEGTPSLNATGGRHLAGIIRRITMVAAPIRVEPSGDPGLDQRRRAAIVESLVNAGAPAGDTAARVIIGGTRAEGLRYLDVEALYFRGATIYSGGGFGGGGLGGGFGGGFGGGGFGGGGFGR